MANLWWKAERKFSYGEELNQRMSGGGGHNDQARLMSNATISQHTTNDTLVQKNKHSQVYPYNHHTCSPF